MVSRALQVKKDGASHMPQRNTLWLGFSHLFPVASDWSRNGPMVHIWQMKQKERSVGRLPVIVLPGKKKKTHRNSQEESNLLQPFLFALNVYLILAATITMKWQNKTEESLGP